MKVQRKLKKILIPVRDERGIALTLAILVVTLLLLLGGHFMTASLTEHTITRNDVNAARAFYLAEAGTEHARKTLGALDLTQVLDGTTTVFAGGSTVNLAGGSYTVQVTNNIAANGFPRGTIPADPSASAIVDGDDIVVMTSTGTFQNGQQTVETVLQGSTGTGGFPDFPAAVVMVSKGNNEFDFEDSTLINGFDGSGTCDDGPAFVNSSQTLYFDSEGGVLKGDIQDTPDPWRLYDKAIDDNIFGDPDGLMALVDGWKNLPGVVTISGPKPTPPVLGTKGKPQITVWDIDPKGRELVVPENGSPIKGYGILIVTGEIALEGEFEFHGLIVQASKRQLTIGKGGGTKNQAVHGVILAVDNQDPIPCAADKKCVEKGELPADTKVDIEDETQVLFNCDALNKYAMPLGGGGGGGAMNVLSWRRP